MNITILIHTRNEEKNISDCINSAKLLTDKIILIDMESVDKTVEIAKKLNVTVFNFPKSSYVEPAREFGIKKSKTDWILILDADERITEKLVKEINESIEKQSKKIDLIKTYYKIPRQNIFAGIQTCLPAGRWLKHGGWWPDYQIRLINKKYFINWPKRIHSTPKIKGDFGYFKNPLVHYFHGDLSNMVKKTIIFEDIESDLLYKAGRKTTTKTFFRKFLAELYRRLIKNVGFLDGTIGIIESIYQAFSKTITYLFLYEKQNKKACLSAGRVALYNPYLDTLGGGEKHILSILEVFAEQGYEINIFWDKNLNKTIKSRFSFGFIDKIKWLPNIFKSSNILKNLLTLKSYDYFFYVTDGSYFFSSAKKNYVYAMVPDKKLYSRNLINQLKLINYCFITHSVFTQKWLKKFGIESEIITPYLAENLIDQNINSSKKDKIILSVGRFFSHLHTKRQDLIIKTFKDLKKKSKKFSEYKLLLTGGLKNEDQEYFDDLKKLAGNDPSIIFKPNIPINELYKLYELSSYFWHFSGYKVNEDKNPELIEHFGITPLEAMASSCLTFCYSAGGPKELINDSINGFLFSDTDQLIDKMIKIDSDQALKEKIINNGKQFVKENFSYEIFKKKILTL
jgi:glycosyltransferase involved in cell wall biosynthesis